MISILVPIYNVEQYLQRCIQSVISQSFTDWEMILVDDGSSDSCPQMCDDAAAIDTRIKVIHKPNGGLPSARLAAFREARGEYLIFLDSDDWLLSNALQALYDSITSDGGYDLVRSKVMRVANDGREWFEEYGIEQGIVEGDNAYLKLMQGDSVAPYLHSAIYRRDIFSESAFLPLIDFKISVGEDWLTNYYIAPKVKRMKFIESPTFAYFINTASIMGGSVYGWGYYDRMERCKRRINIEIGNEETEDYLGKKALLDLRYFFFPEVSFSWSHFHMIQPLAVMGLKLQYNGNKSSYNPKHVKFVRCGWLYYLYTSIYRLLFWTFKLKCVSRKVIN